MAKDIYDENKELSRYIGASFPDVLPEMQKGNAGRYHPKKNLSLHKGL